MERGYKYLYLLKFKEEPLIKIGEGTKDSKSNYDRIKNHLRTYGSVFDLKGSYEIIAPKNYSISALERQLKDITALFIPDGESFLKYKGKDGATEIRKEECLIKILGYLRHQQSFIDIRINKGITFNKKAEKPIKIKKVVATKISDEEKFRMNFPFEYKNQKHLIDLVLLHFYAPNIGLVNNWYYEKKGKNGHILILDTNKIFSQHIFAYDSRTYKRGEYGIVWLTAVKSDIKIKWIFEDLLSGKREESLATTCMHLNLSKITYIEIDRVIIRFELDNNRLVESSENLDEWNKWFENGFVEPLKASISTKEQNNLKTILDEL